MILIILPVKDEIKTIKRTIPAILQWCTVELAPIRNQYEILIVDDGSTDGTFEYLKEFRNDKVRVLRNQFDHGKGSALKAGYIFSTFTYALKPQDIVIFMDGDGQIDPNEILTFLNLKTLYNADVVIGNKRHKYSITEYSISRQIVSMAYNFMVRSLFGINIRDTQCGIKLFTKNALDLVIERVTSKRYAFDLELLVALRQMKMRVVDGPVTLSVQLNRGSISPSSIWATFWETIDIWKKSQKLFYIRKI